jgi:hypothetical protein
MSVVNFVESIVPFNEVELSTKKTISGFSKILFVSFKMGPINRNESNETTKALSTNKI